MASIRRTGRVLILAGALSLPSLALAEQPTQTCEGDGMEEREPTADKSESKKHDDKASKKTDDKSEQKRETKDAQKPDSV